MNKERTSSNQLIISSFDPAYCAQAADLFVQNFKALRRAVPALPDRLENPVEVATQLEQFFRQCPGVMMCENDRLIGYLGWYIVERFRETPRRGAYVPNGDMLRSLIASRKSTACSIVRLPSNEVWLAAGCMPSRCWRTIRLRNERGSDRGSV